MFQPAAMLELEVYHNEQRSMQRIKECSWGYLYNDILSQVVKTSVALYIVELLLKVLKQPENNVDLYAFCEDALMKLEASDNNVAANFPMFFCLHLADFFGFKISIPINMSDPVFLDMLEGEFVQEQPSHPHFLNAKLSYYTAELLKTLNPSELQQLPLNKQIRWELLIKYQEYYALHVPGFGQLKTLQVMHEVL